MPAIITTHASVNIQTGLSSSSKPLATMNPDSLLKTPVAAEILGVSASYLYKDRMRAKPTVPYTKIGSSIRYRVGNLQAFIIQNTHS